LVGGGELLLRGAIRLVTPDDRLKAAAAVGVSLLAV
jgi:hypothetical protein